MKVCLLFGCLLLFSGVVLADEDCVEGEDGCEGPAPDAAPKPDAQNSIYILTDQNFAEIVKKEEMIMATFYAPW